MKVLEKLTPEEERVANSVVELLIARLSGSSKLVEDASNRKCMCGQVGNCYIDFMRVGHMANSRRVYFCDAHFVELNKVMRKWSKEMVST